MNCDGIAPFYQSLEYASFGKELERRRFAFLAETASCENALICGGGDGRFLARLLRCNPKVQVDFVDLSAKMIRIAESRISGMGRGFLRRVDFHCDDIRNFRRDREGYDLIVTHFFLDCFAEEEIDAVVGKLAAAARPGAWWLLSEFQEKNSLVGSIFTRATIRMLYEMFHFTTGLSVFRLPDYARSLAAQGLRCEYEQKSVCGLLCSSLWRVAARLDRG